MIGFLDIIVDGAATVLSENFNEGETFSSVFHLIKRYEFGDEQADHSPAIDAHQGIKTELPAYVQGGLLVAFAGMIQGLCRK